MSGVEGLLFGFVALIAAAPALFLIAMGLFALRRLSGAAGVFLALGSLLLAVGALDALVYLVSAIRPGAAPEALGAAALRLSAIEFACDYLGAVCLGVGLLLLALRAKRGDLNP